MIPLERVDAVALPVRGTNLDTDQIIPARFLSRARHEGFGEQLFHDLRYREHGQEVPDFVLNQPAYRIARIVVGERNFGCGSSREHAVWALADYGVRAVVAPSFGDIFRTNCLKNGVIPAALPDAVIQGVLAELERHPGSSMTVDLRARTVTTPDGMTYTFEIDDFARACILDGVDELAFTLQQAETIAAFEHRFGRENR